MEEGRAVMEVSEALFRSGQDRMGVRTWLWFKEGGEAEERSGGQVLARGVEERSRVHRPLLPSYILLYRVSTLR